MPLGVQTFTPRPTSGGGGGAPQPYPRPPIATTPATGPTPLPADSPDRHLNPYGRNGNPYAPGPHAGARTVADPWYQWQKSQDALAAAQYNQQVSALDAQRALLARRGGGGGNRAAYDAGMQALASDRARLAADQALSAAQRRFAATNLDLSNRSQHGALMSDAVSRGADTSVGVAANYADITDKNKLNYDQAIAQADRNDAYLAQLAKDYGVKESQLKAALARGAAAYGMSYATAMMQLDEARSSLDLNRQAAAQQTILTILQQGGNPYGSGVGPRLVDVVGAATYPWSSTPVSSGGTRQYV